MKKTLIFCWGLAVSLNTYASCSDLEPWKVCASTNSSTNKITMGVQEIASASSISNLFGLHSLWWTTQNAYMNTNGTFITDSISQLKSARPSIIRNGGDTNGIHWGSCVGDQSNRPVLSIALYNLKYVCKFGPAEYEMLNNNLGLDSSWYVANIVGYNGNIQEFDSSMQQSLNQYVSYVRGLALNKKIYWELGNELEFLSAEHWYADEIISRANIAASIIHAVDPNAKVIMPLLAYTPSWMSEKSMTYSKHNSDIIEGTKGNVDGYSFHLYYDHKNSWVKVSSQINFIANQYSLISSLGIANPQIWITEHAVWPEGDYLNYDEWRKNWYKTGNFDGMLSTADFIAGLTQVPGISGAMYHSLGYSEVWSFLVKDLSNKLAQSKISLLYQLFSPAEPMVSVNTLTESSVGADVRAATVDKYSMPINQYKFRAAGFNVLNSNKKVLWIVNRGGDADITINANFSDAVKAVSIIQNTMVDNNDNTDVSGISTPIETTTSTIDLDNGVFSIISKNKSITVLDITPLSSLNTDPSSDNSMGTDIGSSSASSDATSSSVNTVSGDTSSTGESSSSASSDATSSSVNTVSGDTSSTGGSSASVGSSLSGGGVSTLSANANQLGQTPVIATYGFSAGALSAEGSDVNTLIASDDNFGQLNEINNLSLVDNSNSSFKVLLQFKEAANILVTSSDSGKVLIASEKNSGDEVAINSNEKIKISVSDLDSTAIYYNGELISKSELNSQKDSDGMIVFQ